MRKVFFSFHYQNDVWRVSQVRNSWVTKPNQKASMFVDFAEWEKVKRSGELAIKRWIDFQMSGTSVTVVLIGEETYNRKYVKYEIEQSHKQGKGILAIHISGLNDQYGRSSKKGINPLNYFRANINGQPKKFSEIYSTYSWGLDYGFKNLPLWIETAAQQVGR